MYLGEIARRMIVHLAQIGCLPSELEKALSKPWSFETKHCGMITADHMPGLRFTRAILGRCFGADVNDLADLHTINQVCCLVRDRSARQGAMISSAPLLKIGSSGLATIAVDGSVYEKMPSFQRIYKETVNRILGK
uniref:Phosphotransferase n=1 Tax=Lygus hesperus TaxID=30085 RepID=A0A146MD07_LYGHE